MEMSIILFILLCVLMVANQMIGIANGWYRDGFSLHKMVCGFQKYGIILLGYGAIALTAYVAGRYIPQMEYISGILLEPIAKYFVKLLNRLRVVLNDNIEDVIDHKKTSKRSRNARRTAGSSMAEEIVAGSHVEPAGEAATVQLISMTPAKPVKKTPYKPLNQSLPEAVSTEGDKKKRTGAKKSAEA